MPLPIALTLGYLAINLAMMVWLERRRAGGNPPVGRLAALSGVLRYGPPLLGLLWLVTTAGDWIFVAFVAAFFAGSFWLMDGLLAYTPPNSKAEAMRSGWDDRGTGKRSGRDREAS